MSVFDHCGLFLALNRHVEHSVGQGANSAGQAGHVEHSVGQGADSAGQAGHVEHRTVALNKDRVVNTTSRYSLNDQKYY